MQESQNFCSLVSHKVFQLVWMEFGILLRLIGLVKLVLIFIHSLLKGENMTDMISFGTALTFVFTHLQIIFFQT